MLNLSPAVRALVMSTITYAGAFAAWVINAVLLTFLVSTGSVSFDESQVAVLLGLPILSGAVARIPLGILTDRYGGRPMMTVLLLIVSGGLYSLSFATTYSDFL